MATALAAAHDSIEPHLNLHACSVRRLMRWGSPRAFALAVDHRPPTSRAITTGWARRWTPTSSGNVRAFLFRAYSRATPSTSAAPLLAVPCPLSALTNVVYNANCAPHNRGRPSAMITSRRLPSGPCRCSRSRSRHGVGRDSANCLSANPHQHALQSKPSPPQNSSPRARSMVVATWIKWTDTPARTRGQRRRRQTKAPKEQNPAELKAERRARTGGQHVTGSLAPGPP